jgi:hypothetical protein
MDENINIDSFRPKSELNQKFWDEDGKLNAFVRKQLLIIARDFLKDLDFDSFPIEDILMTGSLANYNWNEEYSDIDLHILMDFSQLGNKVIIKQMFDAIRKNWNDNHKDINIFDYPVEIYVQDIDEPHKSSGVYSVLYDDWKEKPDADYMNVEIDDELIEEIAGNYEDEINALLKRLMDAETDEEFEKIYDDADKLYDEIKACRKKGMEKEKPEMSSENLVFKALRRNGSIEKLIDIRTHAYDMMLSI